MFSSVFSCVWPLAVAALFALAGCAEEQPAAKLQTVTDVAATQDAVVGDASGAADAEQEAIGTDATAGGCNVSADCPGEKDLCINGSCSPQTVCKSDKQCANLDLVCDPKAGVCVECLGAADCKEGKTCKAHKCLGAAPPCATSKECPTGLVCDKVAGACVECAVADDCSKGFSCVETVCSPQYCLPGSVQCADSQLLETCNAEGSSFDQTPCPKGEVCDGDACKPTVCTPGAKDCQGPAVVTCNAAGTAWVEPVSCPGEQLCSAGQCLDPVCEPGKTECQGGAVATCKPDALSWSHKVCETGQVCAAGSCVAKVCEAKAAYCKAGTPMQCDDTGSKASALPACTANQLCLGGKCVAAACKVGDTVCADSATLATCKADGSGYGQTACPGGSACTQGACKSLLCQPSQVVCQGTKRMQCDAAGTALAVLEDCATTGKSCASGACTAQAGFAVRGSFESLSDTSAGGYRLQQQGWLIDRSCGQNYFITGGFAP